MMMILCDLPAVEDDGGAAVCAAAPLTIDPVTSCGPPAVPPPSPVPAGNSGSVILTLVIVLLIPTI